jgi:hypothetical protein
MCTAHEQDRPQVDLHKVFEPPELANSVRRPHFRVRLVVVAVQRERAEACLARVGDAKRSLLIAGWIAVSVRDPYGLGHLLAHRRRGADQAESLKTHLFGEEPDLPFLARGRDYDPKLLGSRVSGALIVMPRSDEKGRLHSLKVTAVMTNGHPPGVPNAAAQPRPLAAAGCSGVLEGPSGLKYRSIETWCIGKLPRSCVIF